MVPASAGKVPVWAGLLVCLKISTNHKHRLSDKEAAIRSIVDSFHQAEQMVPANEVLPTYTM